MSGQIIDFTAKHAATRPVLPIDVDSNELDALWRYYRFCNMCDQIQTEHKLGAVLRVHDHLAQGATVSKACKIASEACRYAPGTIRRAYEITRAYDEDCWPPLLINARGILARSDGPINQDAWEFILAALRHPMRPDKLSVVRRATALAHEREWDLPQDRVILQLLRDYRAARQTTNATAALFEFPIRG